MGSLRTLAKPNVRRVRTRSGFQILVGEYSPTACLDWNGVSEAQYEEAQNALDRAHENYPFDTLVYRNISDIPEEFDDASFCIWIFSEKRWGLQSKVSVMKKTGKHKEWAEQNVKASEDYERKSKNV
jgi:hypothetical protein